MGPGRLGSPEGPGDSYGGYRARLVEAVRQRGVQDLAVLRAIATVPRHLFVPDAIRHRAYEDNALPIGAGQTISQPSVQARSLEFLALTGGEKVLEVGAGSGYQTALLAQLGSCVFAVERLVELAQRAKAALDAAGIRNVSVLVGDGTLGWRSCAPFDAIVVAAASPEIPKPLLEQLRDGGRLVIPLGSREAQTLTLAVKTGNTVHTSAITDVRFVPLLGQFGFNDRDRGAASQ